MGKQPLTNMEMYRVLRDWKERKWAIIERDGCCGERDKRGPNGECWGVGICPAVCDALEMMGDYRHGKRKRTYAD